MEKKKSGYQVVVDQITGIFLPIINIITAASILKSIVVLLAAFGVISENGGFYQIFYAATDGFFYFLPFYLAYAAAKQWKADPYIALLIPVAMLYPDITAVLENGGSLNLFGLNVPPTIYHSSVIPVVMAVGLLHFVEKPCDRYIPESIRGFLKPMVCCLVVLPVTFLVFGPMGTWIGDVLTKVFFAVYEWNPIAAGAFMGFVMQPMVVVGAHWSVVPVSISNILLHGYDVIMPLVGGAVYAQAGAALAVGLMYKENKEKQRVAYQASLTAALGVTEPALFGVNVPLLRPMLAACLSGAIGGAMVGFAGTHCTSFAFPSFLTSVAFVGPGFGIFLFSMAFSFALGFLFTWVQKKAICKRL
ncbi:MAG: PTS transporter subunit EIIC [Acetatifactor sp.]|nr:PTS transporter subunit EIIC [Acetatifactor sp.]